MIKKLIPVKIPSVLAYVNVNYFFTFPAFINVRLDFSFRFQQIQISAVRRITSYFLLIESFPANKGLSLIIIINHLNSGNKKT